MNISQARILCIDDDTNTVNWIRIMLKSSKVDCAITTANTGREAFNLLNSEDFDLCILEYALPDMTGVQLCTLIRQMGSDVPMLFFTAMNRQVDREKALYAGADEYLCKPDDLDVFVNTVNNLLRKPRPIFAGSPQFTTLAKAA